VNRVARTRKAIVLAVAVASGSAMAQGVPDDRVARLQQYEARAAQGDAVAAEQAALMHYHAAPREQRNLHRVVFYLQMAAANGSPAAQLMLDHLTEQALAGDAVDYLPGPWGC